MLVVEQQWVAGAVIAMVTCASGWVAADVVRKRLADRCDCDGVVPKRWVAADVVRKRFEDRCVCDGVVRKRLGDR